MSRDRCEEGSGSIAGRFLDGSQEVLGELPGRSGVDTGTFRGCSSEVLEMIPRSSQMVTGWLPGFR